VEFGAFEALHTFSKVGHAFFESVDAAIELGVRELDHRLRFGETAPHFAAYIVGCAVELFVKM